MKKIQSTFKSITESIKSQKHSINNDPFDIRHFERIRDNNPRILETYEDGVESYPQFEELQQDVFSSLYKYVPELAGEGNMEMAYKLNHQVMDSVIESPKYKELRILTKLDSLNATIGTEVLGEQVKNLVHDLQQKFEQLQQQLQEAQANVDAAEQAESDGEQEEGEGGEGKAKQVMDLETAKKLLEEAMHNLDNQLQKKEQRRLNNALDNTLQETRRTSDLISNWGLDQDPAYHRLGHAEKIKLVNRLKRSRKLKELALMAGRYRRLAAIARHNKIKSGNSELYDTTLGDELSKILPNEQLKLANPKLKLLFKKAYLDKQLLQYEYQGKTKQHKGPIVCCIDGSGSMHGSSEIWAKSVAISLLDIARGQNRNFFVIHFDATWDTANLHTNQFLKNEPYNVAQVIDMAEYFPGGGTLFEPPLTLAKQKIEEDEGFSKADIIFITDGCSTVRDEWLADFTAWKSLRNINIYSVLIDAGYNTDTALQEFSDQIMSLTDLEKEKDAAAMELFGLV